MLIPMAYHNLDLQIGKLKKDGLIVEIQPEVYQATKEKL